MSKLREISYPVKGEYKFDTLTFDYDCKVWLTHKYEAVDVIFTSILVYDASGDVVENHELSIAEIENIKACAVQKALEKVQAVDFEGGEL